MNPNKSFKKKNKSDQATIRCTDCGHTATTSWSWLTEYVVIICGDCGAKDNWEVLDGA
jgi:transcription elongation factor Elf1